MTDRYSFTFKTSDALWDFVHLFEHNLSDEKVAKNVRVIACGNTLTIELFKKYYNIIEYLDNTTYRMRTFDMISFVHNSID